MSGSRGLLSEQARENQRISSPVHIETIYEREQTVPGEFGFLTQGNRISLNSRHLYPF